jgi:hypothetical protein
MDSSNIAPKKRLEIYKNFKKYVQQKDERSMDDICISPNSEFQLQAQQKFLSEYMVAYPNWQKLLLFHGIGSGKTCTAITMAEEYLKTYPNNKINVVLPARLKTNFFDELISPCGFDKYISKDDFIKFNMSSTSIKIKKQIKLKFMKAIESKYNIMSFEKLKLTALKHSNDILSWINTFTKDSMLIVDEVHNLIASTYDEKRFNDILSTGKISGRAKGMNTILFKLITTNAHLSSKMIFLTATPIFDNIVQLKELVKIMTPEAIINKGARISDIIDFLRGKVSYFPGTSINAYPSTEYNIHNVVISKTQDIVTRKIIDESSDEKNEEKEAFMAKQRQASITCLPGNKTVKGNINQVLSNISEYSPKIEAMMKVINSSPGKHIIYSNFVQTGIDVIEQSLLKEGWKNIKDVVKDEDMWIKYKGKVFATWSGNTKDVDKSMIKSIANKKENIFGDKIRVILGSPSVKEGVSFKHIQHLHLLDPVWNQSAKTQIEGRAIRFCSHVDINEKINKPLKRKVIVDIYKLIPRPKGLVKETCDQKIYDDIIPRKQKLIKAGEIALRKVAIDNYLFRNLYVGKELPSPKSLDDSAKSNINLLERENVILKNNQKVKQKGSTCPKKRRPDEEGHCDDGYYKKNNSHGDECCYKNKKTQEKNPGKTIKKPTKCPADRLPDSNGNCKDGFKLKLNKGNMPCCFKIYKVKESKN